MRDRLGQRAGGKRGPLTGPNPTDRGKLGSKIHLMTDRNELPLSLSISGANMHDTLGLQTARARYPADTLTPRTPQAAAWTLHADKGYDYDYLRRWLRGRRIRHRIARKSIESSQRLGHHRWVVERPCPGWPAAGVCTGASNARLNTSSPSSASPQPSFSCSHGAG